MFRRRQKILSLRLLAARLEYARYPGRQQILSFRLLAARLRYPRHPGGGSRVWVSSYLQQGLGTLGVRAATADLEFQAIGSKARYPRIGLGQQSNARNARPGIQTKDSKPKNPSPEIKTQESEPRNPTSEMRAMEPKLRNANPGIQFQESQTQEPKAKNSNPRMQAQDPNSGMQAQ